MNIFRIHGKRGKGYFSRGVAAVVAVVMLSVGIGAFAMGGIESLAASASSNSLAYKRMDVKNFDRIEISDLLSVEYRQGKFPGYVELETLPGYIDNFEVKVIDGTLKLGCHVNNGPRELKFIVKVTAPQLKEVRLDGGVTSFKVEGPLSFGDEFLLRADGVNSVSFGEVTGKKLTINTEGVTTIYMLAAELQELNILAAGVSDMRLKGLNVDNIDAKAESVSSIVLGGRCRSITKEADIPSKIDTKGLIVEKSSPKADTATPSGQTMPRIP